MIARRIARTGRTRPHKAFTLVEILVVIALLSLLASIAIPLLHTDSPQQQMQQACERLSSLMAMCRAQAMLLGHPVQITWQVPQDNSTTQTVPQVMHEADPIDAPGEFKPMAASWATEPVLPNSVQIRLVQPGDFDLSSLTKTQGRFDLPSDPSVQTVQFHPDGTADPAVFVLTSKLPEGSEQDELQGWVVLNAVSGLAEIKKPPTPEQFDAMLKAQAALPDLQLQEKAVEVSQTDSTGTADMLAQTGITKDGLADFIASLGGNGASAANALRGATGGATGNTAAGSGASNKTSSGSATAGGSAATGNRSNNNSGTSGGAGSNNRSAGSGASNNTNRGNNNNSNSNNGSNTSTGGGRSTGGNRSTGSTGSTGNRGSGRSG